MATISATMTDQMPLTDAIAMPPHCGSARKLVSRRGITSIDIVRLTRTTMISGNAATSTLGSSALW